MTTVWLSSQRVLAAGASSWCSCLCSVGVISQEPLGRRIPPVQPSEPSVHHPREKAFSDHTLNDYLVFNGANMSRQNKEQTETPSSSLGIYLAARPGCCVCVLIMGWMGIEPTVSSIMRYLRPRCHSSTGPGQSQALPAGVAVYEEGRVVRAGVTRVCCSP